MLRHGLAALSVLLASLGIGVLGYRITEGFSWVDSLLNCRPAAGQPNVRRPRPECFWPVDALELAERLLKSGEAR